MSPTALRPDATLPELLAARAHAASDRRLGLDVSLGALVAAAALVARFPGWPVLLPAALCFVAFGAWGLADRRLAREHALDDDAAPVEDEVLRLTRAAAAVLGTVAAVALVLAVCFLVMGRSFMS